VGVLSCQLLPSGLALTILIEKGPGFGQHTDSSPPFDLTLDMCIDHQGPDQRPIYFLRRIDGKSVVSKLVLRYGEAVLFKGAEMTHWGGDLPEGSFHAVQLYTWQYARE